ncbi:DMT family transporter [archaeon]|jgi:S-adenosylmethionine uptake transporter|nr:DMT family transporter [archaeon]
MTQNKSILLFLWCVFLCCVNDVIVKKVGGTLHFTEIAFAQSFFATANLLPFLLFRERFSLRSDIIHVHMLRGVVTACAIVFWFLGLQYCQIPTATLLGYTIPIFVLIFARMFLKEEVSPNTVCTTLICFIGVGVTIIPSKINFHLGSVILILGSIFYALENIINKKYCNKESIFNLLFYVNLFSALLLLGPAVYHWTLPNSIQFGLLFTLGVASNVALFSIITAYKYLSASFLAPFQYTELVFAIVFGYTFFSEFPDYWTFLGGSIIFIGTLLALKKESTILEVWIREKLYVLKYKAIYWR